MRKIFLSLLGAALALVPVFAETSEDVPAADTAVAVPPLNEGQSITAADSAVVETAPAVVASPSADTAPVAAVPAPDTAAKAAGTVQTVAKAAEDSTGGMEWKTLSDTDTARAPMITEPANASAVASTTSTSHHTDLLPDIPPDRESRVLLCTGGALVALGGIAFLVFNGGSRSKASSAAPSTDNGGAITPETPTQKNMTIKWAQ